MSIFQVLGGEEQIQESLAIRERVVENFHSSIFAPPPIPPALHISCEGAIV
jgi:hypothetical protein